MYRIVVICIIIGVINHLMEDMNSSHIGLKLKFVQIVFRHGIRAPVLIYPTNPYDENYWDEYGSGLGQLTPEGMNEMHDFGVYLKEHYSSFLTQHYHPKRIRVRATNSDRAIQSASTLLAGLYQPNERQKWKRDWLPIPVYNSELKYDDLFVADNCPRYHKKKRDMLQNESFKSIQKENWSFLKNMSKLSHIDNFGLHKIWIIADNYLVANAMNLHSPRWVLENKEKLMELHEHTMKFRVFTQEMAKLVSGPLLNHIIINTQRVVKKEKEWELFLFSSHDYYINGLLKLLNLGSIGQPNFAAALFFELYECKETGEHFIKVYYKNNPENSEITRTLVTIEGCDDLCPLDKFYELVEDKKVTDQKKYCKLE